MRINTTCPLNKNFSSFEDRRNRIFSHIDDFLEKISNIGIEKNTLNIYTYNDLMQFKKVEAINSIKCCPIHKGTYIFITHENNNFISCNLIFYGKNNTCIIAKTAYGITNLTIDMGGGSSVFIDTDFSCGPCTLRLRDGKNIFIGKDNMFSSEITLWPSDGHAILDKYGNCINDAEDIILGDHIWLGFKVNILKGSFINDGSVVGIASLVNKKFYEPNVVIAGSPARIIRNQTRWTRKNPTHLRQYALKCDDKT